MAGSTRSYEQLTAAFSHGNFKPVTLLYGPERFFIDRLQRLLLETALAPSERDFNLDIVYGQDVTVAQALGLCAGYPVMAERRVVVIREFDQMKEVARFKAYVESPNPSAIVLLIAGEKVNKSRHPYRALKAAGSLFEFPAIKDRELPGWIRQYAEESGYQMNTEAVRMLSEYVGSDLSTAAMELEKLATLAGDRDELTGEDVVRASGHTREFNVFELQRAVGQKDYTRALRIADRLLQQASNAVGEAIMVVSVLAAFFTKLWILTACQKRRIAEKDMASLAGVPPYYLKEYLSFLARTDSASLADAFSALTAADFELKGGSNRDAHVVLTLLIRRLSTKAGAAYAA